MRINTNTASLSAQEASILVNKRLSSSLEKLSTGLRINKAADDSSGMTIADKLRTQASTLGQGIANANSASSFIQIADKAMAEQSNILDMVKTKLMQAATSTTSSSGVDALSEDIKALLTQFDLISTSTNYNGTTLLDGADFTFQIGSSSADKITVSTSKAATTSSLAISSMKSSGTSAGNAVSNMAKIDTALTNLNKVRSEFGAGQNQVESALRNMMTTKTNILAAESVVRDVDYASESANFNKQNIIAQAGTYAISQANAVQQNVLRLLQ
jgi:flagellin